MIDDFREVLLEIVSSSSFQQIFPIFVVFFVPLLVVTLATHTSSLVMVLESLFPWWSSSSTDKYQSHHTHHRHHEKRSKKSRSSRSSKNASSDKIELKDAENPGEEGYYSGLVNISGTYCFMNSTVQALSSLSYLQPQIDAIHSKAVALDVATPVIDSLRDVFHRLNTPRSSPSSIRPVDLISVLSNPSAARSNSLFSSREHQDAQELFQLLSECIKNEAARIGKEAARDRGLGGLSSSGAADGTREFGKSVFDGLTANRRSCCLCGYTEAVMHFSFDSWQLAVPRFTGSCFLEDLLVDYTRLEMLKDCICRKCSAAATQRRLQLEVKTLAEAIESDEKPSSSKKRRLKEVRRMEARVRMALEEGRIEEELKDVRMEKVFGLSTKQAMIARPPPVLVLHINRSMHMAYHATKNNIRVIFPEVLDLTPFTTSGNLSTVPTSSMSTPSPQPTRSSTPTPASFERTIYRLAAVVCHFGAHSFGHYICYRRKPIGTWAPPKAKAVLGVPRLNGKGTIEELLSAEIEQEEEEEEEEEDNEPVLRYVWDDAEHFGSGRGWLRISDDSVSECGMESVLAEGSGAFMLYYERAVVSFPGEPVAVPAASTSYQGYGVGTGTPRSSEETLKPKMMMTVATESGSGERLSVSPPSHMPRIVRSVTASTRGRSTSAAPSEKGRAATPVEVMAKENGHVVNGSAVHEGEIHHRQPHNHKPEKQETSAI